MKRVLGEHGTRLTELDGIGPVVAGRLLGRTGHAGRFADASAFANYAGVAPIEIASGPRARHRLPRAGDRQLNLALHVVALTQVRMRANYDRKVGEGENHNEAMRCLNRRLADRVWRTMIADERRTGADVGSVARASAGTPLSLTSTRPRLVVATTRSVKSGPGEEQRVNAHRPRPRRPAPRKTHS